MSTSNEPPDELPVFRPGAAKVHQERVPGAPSFKGSLLKTVNRIGKRQASGRGSAARGGHRQRGAKPASVKTPGLASRRVIIKARYVQQGEGGAGDKAARLHLKYVERDGVNREGGKGRLYSAGADGVEGEKFLARAKGDPQQFRFIVSPEDAAQLDLTAFTRDLMGQVAADLDRRLDWVAVNHYDTENPHTHILLRGRDVSGAVLRIDGAYLAHGMRDRARELATRELGPRLGYEIDAGLKREVGQARWTSLDVRIEGIARTQGVQAGVRRLVSLGEPGGVVPVSVDRFVVGRLKHLEVLGLAEAMGPRLYLVSAEHRAVLRALGEKDDIIKRMHRLHHGQPGEYRIFDAARDRIGIAGELTHKGLADELNDRRFVIVATPDGRRYHVQLPGSADFEALKAGSMVSVDSIEDPWLKPADRVIAAQAEKHGGVYRPALHAEELKADAALARRGIDAQAYALAHSRRARRLARFGFLSQRDGGYGVPADLEARLSVQDREQPNPRVVALRVLDQRPLTAQVKARGPAWIDTVDLDGAGRSGFGAALRDAGRRRALFLRQTLGLDPGAADVSQQLKRLERSELAAAHAVASGKQEAPLVAGKRRRGRLVGQLTGDSGAGYALVEFERSFSLAPWRQSLQHSVGKSVSIGMDRAGLPLIAVAPRGLGR